MAREPAAEPMTAAARFSRWNLAACRWLVKPYCTALCHTDLLVAGGQRGAELGGQHRHQLEAEQVLHCIVLAGRGDSHQSNIKYI